MTSTVTESSLLFVCQNEEVRGAKASVPQPSTQEAGITSLLRTAWGSVDAIIPLIQINLSPVFTPASSAGPPAMVLTMYRPF